jgi:hypothetical protein
MKTRIVIGLSLVVLVLAMANLFVSNAQQAIPASAQQPAGNGAPPLSNPLKVALLKWYKANTAPTEFAVGAGPLGVAFDGANIWVAAGIGATKLRASDGAVLGMFAAGNGGAGVTFDGANVWVSSPDSTVTKLRASDGKNLGSFPVPGVLPWWMAFDGANIWVPSSNASGNGWVTKLRASDGKNLGNFAVGISPLAVAFDGANVWITNGGGSVGTVTKLRASDGKVLGTFAVGNAPLGIAFDGANMWIANLGGSSVTKLRASDGAVLGTFGTPPLSLRGSVRRGRHLGHGSSRHVRASGERWRYFGPLQPAAHEHNRSGFRWRQYLGRRLQHQCRRKAVRLRWGSPYR